MKRIILGLICGATIVAGISSPALALDAACIDGESEVECRERVEELNRRWEAGEPMPRSVDSQDNTKASTEVAPTFVVELDDSQQSFGLWAGKSLLLAGNNLTTSTEVKNGLLLVAGNNLNLKNSSEYGFVLGNIIKFAGSTKRDLYVAGNMVTLASEAKIGRDVFVASGDLNVEVDLSGDLSVTADRVAIKDDISIDGNVNIVADTIEFGKDVVIGGKLVYNDSAYVSGAENVEYGDLEVYHVQEVSTEAKLAAMFYSKFLSIAGLFLAMALILALYSKLHDKIETETTASRFGTNLAIGIGTLIIVPVVALFALITMVAAPISIVALLIYGIGIYLAQGFTGLWLGHIILEKLFKVKGNPFIEALIGIVILGLLALVPFIGVITGFVSLALGLGLIVSCIKPRRDAKGTKKPTKSAKTGKVTKK